MKLELDVNKKVVMKKMGIMFSLDWRYHEDISKNPPPLMTSSSRNPKSLLLKKTAGIFLQKSDWTGYRCGMHLGTGSPQYLQE